MDTKIKEKSERVSHRRSRSRSRERNRHKHSKNKRKKRSDSSSDSSSFDSSSSRSSSSERRRRKHKSKKSKHKKRDRSKERSKKPVITRPPTAEELERLKEERKRDKDLMKSLETPEEKRLRRLVKKEAKERKRKEQMGWDEEYMGYTNEDNPFGDEHLLDTFVWGKKMEREGKTELQKSEMDKLHKKKMIENKLELEKVKKRRIEREHEREERERDREMMQREKEAEYFREWEKQEDTFHLQQAKLRSKIRIDDARAKPIDLLGKYISAEDDDYAVEMHEPYTYLNGLTMQDLEDLLEDIKVYVELEQGKNVDYWRDITIITEEELNKLRKLDASSKDHYVGERRSGINQAVKDDVAGVFKGKTLKQLHLLGDSIRNKLSGGEGVDVGYWESLLQQLKAHMARTRLRERHQEQLRRKLFKLKQEQGIESNLFPIIKQEKDSDTDSLSKRQSSRNPTPVPEVSTAQEPQPGTSSQEEPSGPNASQDQEEDRKPEISPDAEGEIDIGDDDDGSEGGEEEEAEESVEDDPAYVEYDGGSYSPKLLRPSDLEPDAILIDPDEDLRNLDYSRRHALHTGVAKKDDDEELIKKARAGMNSEEAQFSVQIPVEQPQFIWSDKYRPRKPRFFNRVHTGFEWNKYNQTHYDIDNPPPKIVQGYKFNIFYPDLIDKSKTPEYTLTPLEGSRDFAMLRFRAGPPYEDIAFKIVDREWEYSYKRGFRCQFHNNIFQLWFHFKRYRYRR